MTLLTSQKNYHQETPKNESQPIRFTRRAKLGMAGALLAVGAALGIGTEHALEALHEGDAQAYKVDHPSLLPASEVDTLEVKSGDTGISIARKYTNTDDGVNHLSGVISGEAAGPHHTLVPGQQVLVPKVLEQIQPENHQGS